MRVSVRIDETVYSEAQRRCTLRADQEASRAGFTAEVMAEAFKAGYKTGLDRMHNELQQITVTLEAKS